MNWIRPEIRDIGMLRAQALVRFGLGYALIISLISEDSPVGVSESNWIPISLAQLLGVIPSSIFVNVLFVTAIGLAMLLALGIFTRVTGPVCFVTASLYLCISMSFFEIRHGANSTLLIMFIMLFSDWDAAWSFDAWWRRRGGKPLRAGHTADEDAFLWLGTLAIALPYFSAGLLKIMHGTFLASGSMRHLLAMRLVNFNHVSSPKFEFQTSILEWVVDRPVVADLLAWGSVLFEIGFIIALFSRRLRIMFLSAAIAFHGGISLLMGITFGRHMLVCSVLLLATAVIEFRGQSVLISRAFPKRRRVITEMRRSFVPRPCLAIMLMTLAVLLAAHYLLLPYETLDSWQLKIAPAVRGIMPYFQAKHMPALVIAGSIICLITAVAGIRNALRSSVRNLVGRQRLELDLKA